MSLPPKTSPYRYLVHWMLRLARASFKLNIRPEPPDTMPSLTQPFPRKRLREEDDPITGECQLALYVLTLCPWPLRNLSPPFTATS